MLKERLKQSACLTVFEHDGSCWMKQPSSGTTFHKNESLLISPPPSAQECGRRVCGDFRGLAPAPTRNVFLRFHQAVCACVSPRSIKAGLPKLDPTPSCQDPRFNFTTSGKALAKLNCDILYFCLETVTLKVAFFQTSCSFSGLVHSVWPRPIVSHHSTTKCHGFALQFHQNKPAPCRFEQTGPSLLASQPSDVPLWITVVLVLHYYFCPKAVLHSSQITKLVKCFQKTKITT